MGQVRRLERAVRELDELAAEVGDAWDDLEFDRLANARVLILRHLRGLGVLPSERAA